MLTHLSKTNFFYQHPFQVKKDIQMVINTNLLMSARSQRQTNAEGCRIFGDLDQLKSKRGKDERLPEKLMDE